jgi:predicted RNA-binding Zn-ribbon protein involved in translation (DUF1610 family)
MKIEQSQEYDYSVYSLSDKEIAALILESELDVNEASPLKNIDKSIIAKKLPKEVEELKGALKILAAPERIFCIRTWPAGGDWIDYFGTTDSNDLVIFSVNEDRGVNLVVWPVAQSFVKSMILAPLLLSRAQNNEDNLNLEFREILLLASLVDFTHETVVQNFIDRNNSTDINFTIENIQETYKKGLQGNDPRWMVNRLAYCFKTSLPDKLNRVPEMLQEFCAKKFLMNDGSVYAALPSGEKLLQQLIDIEGLTSLITKRWRSKSKFSGEWEEDLNIYQADRLHIWRYNTSSMRLPSSMITLETVSHGVLTNMLDDLFRIPPISFANDNATKEKACSSCNAQLQPGQKFCPQCGNSVVALEAKVTPEKTVQPKCTNCGKKLKNGLKFCTECGRKI